MDRPLLIRRLRIATSLFFAVVTIALCVLWVRSYWRFNRLRVGRGNAIASVYGSLIVNDVFNLNRRDPPTTGPIDVRNFFGGYVQTWSAPHDAFVPVGLGTKVRIGPFVAAAIALTFAPFLSRRFSLRALLLAITLVAVALGLGVWAAG